MVWIEWSRDGDALTITDGYVQPERSVAHEAFRRRIPFEQVVAERLYRRGKRLDVSVQRRTELIARGAPIPDPLDVWVVGAPCWLAEAPAMIRAIAENDPSPDYRLLVVGMNGVRINEDCMAEWRSWAHAAGLAERRPPRDPYRFGLLSHPLLESMVDYRQRTGAAPTPILADLGVPVAYRGDS